MQIGTQLEQPLKLYRDLLLKIKTDVTEESHENPLSKHLDSIDKDLSDIITAFGEIEKWKKQLAGDFETKIQHLNECTGSDHDFLDWEPLLKSIREDVNGMKQQVGNFVPAFAVEWLDKELSKGGDIRLRPKWFHEWLLQLSLKNYDEMGEQQRECFLCLSMFPEGTAIKPRDMIYWWIGEGLVEPTQGKTAEQVGKDTFAELVSKGLMNLRNFSLKPSIRSKALSDAKERKKFSFDSEGRLAASPEGSSRACLQTSKVKQKHAIYVSPPPGSPELTALLNINVQYVKFDKDVTYRLENLTVLQLGRWASSPDQHSLRLKDAHAFLDCLLGLKSLRYLGLQGVYGIKELPDKIHELSNLMILDLRECHDLEKVPSTIGELKKLTHFDVSQCYLLEPLPSSILQLEELQVLKGFVMDNLGSNIASMAQLKVLRKLCLDLGEKFMVSRIHLKSVSTIGSLRSLTIMWRRSPSDEPDPSVQLDWLPPMLEKLDLRCLPLEVAPPALTPENLKYLKKLYFRGGKFCSIQSLAPKGVASWEVEILRFKHLKDLTMHRNEVPQLFFKIEKVEIMECPKCSASEVWRYKSSAKMFVGIPDLEFIKHQQTSIYSPSEKRNHFRRIMRQSLLLKVSKIMLLLYNCMIFLVDSGFNHRLLFIFFVPLITFLLVIYQNLFIALGLLLFIIVFAVIFCDLLKVFFLFVCILYGLYVLANFAKRGSLALIRLIRLRGKSIFQGLGLFAVSKFILNGNFPRTMVVGFIVLASRLQWRFTPESVYLALGLSGLSTLIGMTILLFLLSIFVCLGLVSFLYSDVTVTLFS